MEHKSFISTLSKAYGTDVKRTGVIADALKDVIVQSLTNLDDVAIPGFGTICAVKTDEYISEDSVSKQRMLMPPAIKASFKISSGLKKTILKNS